MLVQVILAIPMCISMTVRATLRAQPPPQACLRTLSSRLLPPHFRTTPRACSRPAAVGGERARREFALGKGRLVDWSMSKKEFDLGFAKMGFYGEGKVLGAHPPVVH